MADLGMSVNVHPLNRPLVFGDKEQIEALRTLAIRADFDAIPDCERCGGYVEECQRCEGTGKDPDAYAKFRAEYPDKKASDFR
jgi:hypothetical protein